MTQDSINALDNNLFLSGVKVILNPNISSIVDVLKDIEIKVDDKTDIKKIKLETDDSQRVIRQGLLPGSLPCTPFTIILCSLPKLLTSSNHDQRNT